MYIQNTQGECLGNFLYAIPTEDSVSCLNECKETIECTWYNFDRVNDICVLNANCFEIETFNDNFVTGQKECPLHTETRKFYNSMKYNNSQGTKAILFFPALGQLMIVGGYNNSANVLSDVEVVNLKDGGGECEKPYNYPIEYLLDQLFSETFYCLVLLLTGCGI